MVFVELPVPAGLSSLALTQKTVKPRYFRSITQQTYQPIPPRPKNVPILDFVKPGDFIYYKDDKRWDSSPIVLESHKLIFFTIPKVGCTVWKQLFRRMMGYSDWRDQRETDFMPHNPKVNGLKYLSSYSIQEASRMMTSPEWTRALMVRDPKQRFLSAFLDKAVSNDHKHIRSKCCQDGSCVENAQTIHGFLQLCSTCEDDHWRSQHQRIDYKYWPFIDWVGHVETADQDAKDLLMRIGAWDEFGKSGWGADHQKSIFQSKEVTGAGEHATWAQWQVWKWYTPETEEEVERFYLKDYENPLLNLTRGICLTCT